MKTNHLTSHHGESSSHRAAKMSGFTKDVRNSLLNKSKRFYKKFTNKKRRQLLKSLSDKI
jgi:hypothetical protein